MDIYHRLLALTRAQGEVVLYTEKGGVWNKVALAAQERRDHHNARLRCNLVELILAARTASVVLSGTGGKLDTTEKNAARKLNEILAIVDGTPYGAELERRREQERNVSQGQGITGPGG